MVLVIVTAITITNPEPNSQSNLQRSRAQLWTVSKTGEATVRCIIKLFKRDVIKIVCGQMSISDITGLRGGEGGGATCFVLDKRVKQSKNVNNNNNNSMIITVITRIIEMELE